MSGLGCFTLLHRWHSLVSRNRCDGPGKTLMAAACCSTIGLLDGGLAQAFVDMSANPATGLSLGNAATFMRGAEQKGADAVADQCLGYPA